MSERQWTKAGMLAYIYVAMAGATDEVLSDEEKSTIGKSITEWFPDDPKDVVIDEIVKAHNLFVEDYTQKGVKTVADNVAKLADMCKYNIKPEALKFVLEDLVKIALADNNFHENEKVWINTIAEIFEVDYKV
ncbi:MAG: TerB family tellurite resistance protein [Candidatus Cloacimonetes bacterium]|nr:TerB family tellurite resistance protein [Candidatus Cloacimonadota bacterium]